MNKNVIDSVSIKILLDRSMKLASKVVRRLEINSDPPKKEEVITSPIQGSVLRLLPQISILIPPKKQSREGGLVSLP